MKTLAELQKLREETLKKMDVRMNKDGRRVNVGMGTCGIAAGARPILTQFIEELDTLGIKDVLVTQVGCNGECTFEPLVEILDPDGRKTVYVNLNKTKVSEIIKSHLVDGVIIDKYTLQNNKK